MRRNTDNILPYFTLYSMHVPYAKPWIIASLAVMGLDFAVRICKMRVRTATLFAQEGGVARVELDGIKSGWNAGQHVWVRRLSAGSIIESESPALPSLSLITLLHSRNVISNCVFFTRFRPSIFDIQLCGIRSSSTVSSE